MITILIGIVLCMILTKIERHLVVNKQEILSNLFGIIKCLIIIVTVFIFFLGIPPLYSWEKEETIVDLADNDSLLIVTLTDGKDIYYKENGNKIVHIKIKKLDNCKVNVKYCKDDPKLVITTTKAKANLWWSVAKAVQTEKREYTFYVKELQEFK